ncbi:hypothetical protein QZM62_14720 [Burkholderia multivorans]|nr:hypothetical protein [Burkholderia multivorans]
MSTLKSSPVRPSTDVHELQNQIKAIDLMCRVRMEQIAAVSTALLRAMESSEFWRTPNTLRELIGLVQDTANDLTDYVNGAAEQVGCNYVDDHGDERTSRIWDAFRKAQCSEVRHD